MATTLAPPFEQESGLEHIKEGHYEESGSPNLIVLALASTCLVGALIHRLKDYNPLPYTVMMLLYGMCIGGLMHGWPWLDDNLSPLSNISPHLILSAFLPPLIFEGSAALKWTVLSRVLPQCLLLAVPGVIINTLLVSVWFKLVFYQDWSWAFAGLMGALLSATDPVAVVATLKDLDADLAVTIITDGEAIMNDGTSIVLFTVLLPAAKFGHVTYDGEFFGLNIVLLFGGPVLGTILGHLLLMALRKCRGYAVEATILQVAGAYVAWYVAESMCLTSGVLTVMTMAIYVSRRRSDLTRIDEDNDAVHAFWDTLVWIANTLLFAIVGLIVARNAIPTATGTDWGALFASYPILFIIRGIMIALHLPIMNQLSVQLTWQRYIMLIHGALRGGVALALSLIIFGESEDISREQRVSALFLASGIAVLTIVINGTTAKAVVNLLKINVQPDFALYAAKRAEQEILAVIEMGNRSAKFDSTIQLNWAALRELTADAFDKARDSCDVHATEDVIVPIVLRAAKREIWSQRDKGLLSARAFFVAMTYLDSHIQRNTLFHVFELGQFIYDQRGPNTWTAKLPFFLRSEDDAAKNETQLRELEAECFAAFATMMITIEKTVLFLYSRKYVHRDFATWAHHQVEACNNAVNEMQHSESHGRYMINVQTKRAASGILWDARRNVDRIRDHSGLSINQTHALLHKVYGLLHKVKAVRPREMNFAFEAFLLSLPLFAGCDLNDEQMKRLVDIFADDAVEGGETIDLANFRRRAANTHQMRHTAFCVGEDQSKRLHAGLIKNAPSDTNEAFEPFDLAKASRRRVQATEEAHEEEMAPRRSASALVRRKATDDANTTSEPFEAISAQRRRSDLRGIAGARRIDGKPVFGVVLMGTVAKVSRNRITHRCHTGEYFGLLKALSGRQAEQQYIALEDAEYLCGDVNAFRSLLDDDPALKHRVWFNMGMNMVNGILASVFPTAELSPAERLALVKRGRLIRLETNQVVQVPAFSSAFLLHGRSVDDPSVRSRISSRMAQQNVNPNLSSRATHLIPTEMTVWYEAGSYIFVLDDVPLLEARAFALTHIPFVDAALLQMNLGVTSYVRSIFKGADHISSLFRVLGDVVQAFPVLAALVRAAHGAVGQLSEDNLSEMFQSIRCSDIVGPPPRFDAPRRDVFDLNQTRQPSVEHVQVEAESAAVPPQRRASQLPSHLDPGSRHTFVTAEGRYTAAGNEPVDSPDLETFGHEVQSLQGEHEEASSDDESAPTPEFTRENLLEQLQRAADEVGDMQSYIHKILLQHYISQVKIRALVQRIAAFFRLFVRGVTSYDVSTRPVWVRVLCSLLGERLTNDDLLSIGRATKVAAAFATSHGITLNSTDDAPPVPRLDSPISVSLRPEAGIPSLSTKFGALDRIAAKVPDSYSSISLAGRHPPRTLAVSEPIDELEGTPSVLEARIGSFAGSRRNSFHGSNASDTARQAASPPNQKKRERDMRMMAAVNDFDH